MKTFAKLTLSCILTISTLIAGILTGPPQQPQQARAASSDFPPGLLLYTYSLNRVSLQPLMATGDFGRVELFADMLRRSQPLAAINGTYFEAYVKDETKRYPNGLMIYNGKIIRGGTNPSLLVDKRNKGYVTRLKVNAALGVRTYVKTSKGTKLKKADINRLWGINQFWGNVNPSQRVLFTPDWGPRLETTSGVKVVIRSGKVTRITKEPVDIPRDGFVYYDGDRNNWDGMTAYKNFLIGDSIILYTNVTNTERKQKIETADIKFALGAGPILLRKGKVSLEYNGDGVRDPKIFNGDGRRSFIGIDVKGRLVFGSSSRTTIPNLARTLRKKGVYAVLNLDGGAGSSVYVGGKIIVNPDRRLSNIILIKKN